MRATVMTALRPAPPEELREVAELFRMCLTTAMVGRAAETGAVNAEALDHPLDAHPDLEGGRS